jgi:response regulator RpfG family c-di-GMP phosphodiesterase
MNGANIVERRIVEDSRRDDLLFTDIVMPHLSGKELPDRIRAIYPRTKDSACTDSALVHQGVLNEGVMLLQKPLTPSALAQKVREVPDPSSPL